tara:strand:+ start:3622 stop:3987 length:366 start_codon:yes stop_codon:yes gene_type:complete
VSFFVSDSLKNIITEDDLIGASPIKINDVVEKLMLQCHTDHIKNFKLEVIKIELNQDHNSMLVITSKECLPQIFHANNLDIEYSIILNEISLMQDKGVFKLNTLEINNEDNYVTCQIVINK